MMPSSRKVGFAATSVLNFPKSPFWGKPRFTSTEDNNYLRIIDDTSTLTDFPRAGLCSRLDNISSALGTH